jgi:UDP-N-acetylglucosamine 1-carboxyvinyltransferase
MDRFRVAGGARLAGEVAVTGAKNSVLKVMAATLLAEGTTTLTDVPDILDVPIMGAVLGDLGAVVSGHAPEIEITVPAELGYEATYDHVRRIRGSICVLGPLIARCGRARVALPGGDAIGSGRSTCTSAGCSGSASRSTTSTATSSRPHPSCPGRRSGWTSRASARLRTS